VKINHPTKEMLISCPTCHKLHDYLQSKPWSPFCSQRCKQIDLGAWANEEHRIKGEPAPLQEDKEDKEHSEYHRDKQQLLT